MKRTCRLASGLGVAAFLAACASTPVTSVRPLWAGTYVVENSELVDWKPGIGGQRSLSEGARLQLESTVVRASLGVHFGVRYTFEGSAKGTPIAHTVKWTFPGEGLRDPKSQLPMKVLNIDQTCLVGWSCLAGQHFVHQWELVPGTWTLEIWQENSLLFKQTFEVARRDL